MSESKCVELLSQKIHYGRIDIPHDHINPYAIDESVLLYEPLLPDVINLHTHQRLIFNNAVITQEEEDHVIKFNEYIHEGHIEWDKLNLNIDKGDEDQFKDHLISMRQEYLRFLHSAKFNYDSAIQLIINNYKFRHSNLLPATLDEIKFELENGYIYWFGRDLKCRPILYVDPFKLETLEINKIIKLVVFCFEFFLRYLNVGGRAENYIVVIDCCDKSVVQVPLQTIVQLSEIMSSKYRGRLYKMYFINTPKLFNMMMKPIISILPETTSQKIIILGSNYLQTFKQLFNPNQLQEKYGGIQPNINCYYPFKFFPNSTNPNISDINNPQPSKTDDTSTSPIDTVPHEVQSNSLPLAMVASPEVNPAVSSSNSLPVNGNATPGDRGDVEGNKDVTSSGSGIPGSDLRELEGEINREGTTPSGRPQVESCLQDKTTTSDGDVTTTSDITPTGNRFVVNNSSPIDDPWVFSEHSNKGVITPSGDDTSPIEYINYYTLTDDTSSIPIPFLIIPEHVLFGSCLILRGHRNRNENRYMTMMESWLPLLGHYMLTNQTGKYIMTKRPDLQHEVRIVRKSIELYNYISDIN